MNDWGRDCWGQVLGYTVMTSPGSACLCASEELSASGGVVRWAGAGLRGQGVAGFIVGLRQRGIISCLQGEEVLFFCFFVPAGGIGR